jgi:hypothetical protein
MLAEHTIEQGDSMRSVVALAITVAVVSLAGCAASSAENASESASAVATAAPTPTPVEQAATVNEWASLVAQEQLRLDDALQPWDEHSCSALSLEDPLCSAYLVVLQMTTGTSETVLGGAADPGALTYLGTAPDEVADRVADLVTTVKSVSTSGVAATAACPEGDTCISLAAEFTRGIDTLRAAYAGWEPYL